MSLEGLEYILNKKEVVPTVSARDLLERAEQVDTDYKRHVRTYVPISRAAEGRDGQLNVEEFEKKIIKQVKDARAPRGYLTAEYGYGKTSTALYLWQRAEAANLIVVPPFQMLELPDLVTATHGWVRFRMYHHRPDLIDSLDSLYIATIDRSIEKEARDKNISIVAMREWVNQGRFILDLQPTDYIRYFEEVTKIVMQAGFEGLMILPDEIQQYIEPKIASKSGDPIAPFFNLIQGLATRTGYLNFGFIMIIPLKEIGVIREARGRDDLLHRMRELSLDLSSVYDPDFAKRLWERLAYEFDYADIKDNIVKPETLKALGEISTREDISNGPRTVINVFRRMVERYKLGNLSTSKPYSPLDLITDFMDEQAIQFTGDNKIRNVTRRALQSAIVRSDPKRYEPAIKLAAAFPTNGVPQQIQKLYGVEDALNDLSKAALGDLVITVGPIDEAGITLAGLDRVQLQREWLPQTIRDFRRAYGETHDNTRDRSTEVFCTLLKVYVFKNWKIIEERPSNFTSNRSIIFEGDFQSFVSRFPRRRVHVRILWEDEECKDATISGDIAIEYHLSTHYNQENRRNIAQPVELDQKNYTTIVPINLMYVRQEGIPAQIQQQLQGVWSPYDLSPLVLMNIYQMLEEKRSANLIPKLDDQFIKSQFQPELLDNILRDLFNVELGSPLGAAGAGITEQAISRLLSARYGSTYHTLMSVTTWRDSLRKYVSALERLDNLYQKRGDVEVEGTKKQIADLLTSTATGLDSFMNTFNTLLKLERVWPTKAQQLEEFGAVRFSLHSLEEQILTWLRESRQLERLTISGTIHEVHALGVSDVYNRARSLGYQNEEIEAILNLLLKRELIEFYQQHLIREIPSQAPDLDSVAIQLRGLDNDITILLHGFPDHPTLVGLREDVAKWHAALENELKSNTPDPQRSHRLRRTIQIRQDDLRKFANDKKTELEKQLAAMRRGLRPVRPDQITSLGDPITGSVNYVDQVNVLRQALRKQAENVKANTDQLLTQLEQAQSTIAIPQFTYDSLAQIAQEMSKYEEQLAKNSTQVDSFESNYQHLSAWRRLVLAGSTLDDTLQQMDSTTREQIEDFANLARDIRGDISSKALTAKLDALPNHTIYESRLNRISEQVRAIRTQAQDTFTDLQNRYRQVLIANGLFKRDKLDRPIEFNFSNPGDSVRRLHEDIQRQMSALAKQMSNLIKKQRQDLLVLLETEQLSDLSSADRLIVEHGASDLLDLCEQSGRTIEQLEESVQDITIICDFPAPDQGRYTQLIHQFIQVRDTLGEIDTKGKQIRNRLAESELTQQEQVALDQLYIEDSENGEDLIEWRRRVKLSDNEFWTAVRGLYSKRRIRQLVSKVRR